jgi:membrane protease YdiL (CAAX protease family)
LSNLPTGIKPLNLWWSLTLVILPAGAAAVIIHLVIPSILQETGLPFLYLYLPWWIGFMALYFFASLFAYKLEGNSLTWGQFKTRYRLWSIERRSWRWFAALLGTFIVALSLLGILGDRISSIPALSMPPSFPPELNPSHPAGIQAGEFMGVTLKGKWWIAIVYFMGWILNIFGEEFWFRGYMLPRQEAAHGQRAWIVHGLVWAINHMWQLWTLVILLPYSFLWSYIIQKGKNTWIPIIVHGLGNLIPLGVIVIGIIG